MTALLDGRPLVAHAVAALAATPGLAGVVVAARPDTTLPGDLEVDVWIEPGDGPRHPLAGIAHALERARRPVLVLAGDMPRVPSALLARLAAPRRTTGRWSSAARRAPSRCSAATGRRRRRRCGPARRRASRPGRWWRRSIPSGSIGPMPKLSAAPTRPDDLREA